MRPEIDAICFSGSPLFIEIDLLLVVVGFIYFWKQVVETGDALSGDLQCTHRFYGHFTLYSKRKIAVFL